MTQYAVLRTDRTSRETLLPEFEQGRLRQGWGYGPSQDLRELQKKTGALSSKEERDAWRNKRMLASEPRGLQIGDVVILPNLPAEGFWALARVAGPYTFSIHESLGDFGHILPVEPIRRADGSIATVSPWHRRVDARLRGAMRAMARMWSVDHLSGAVENIVRAVADGEDLSVGQGPDQRREEFLTAVNVELGDVIWSRLVTAYRGAELEHLLVPLLETKFGRGTVKHLGGPTERGADLLITTKSDDGSEHKTAIQVKMYDGELNDAHVLEQLREAHKHHQVRAGIVLTTATHISAELEAAAAALAEELGIAIDEWTREDFFRLVLAHLGAVE